MPIFHNTFFEESPDIKIIVNQKDFTIIDSNIAARNFFASLNSGIKKYLPELFPSSKSTNQLKKFTTADGKQKVKVNSIEVIGKKNKIVNINADIIPLKVLNRKSIVLNLPSGIRGSIILGCQLIV